MKTFQEVESYLIASFEKHVEKCMNNSLVGGFNPVE